MATNDTKAYGLVLTLGNAPASPHRVFQDVAGRLAVVPGLYRTDRPTPVGGEGDIDLKLAKELDKDSSVRLKLVEVKPGEVESLRELAQEDQRAARDGAVEARRLADGDEREQVADELKALQGAKT